MALKPFIAEIINRRDLSFEQAYAAMDIIMSGQATQAQIGSYLTGLRMKGETSDEIAGSAGSMRAHVVAVKIDNPAHGKLLDVVGTGGDGANTFNISTTTTFVVAGAGYTVAKHGNRGASSKSGSADVLMALGANLDLSAEQVKICVESVGIGFMYALNHHPAMRHAIGPRRELGQRTIFNLLGPLTNPANATHYLLGVFAPEYTEPMAYTVGKLGAKAAYVVHGDGGLDELSTSGINRVTHLNNGKITTFELDPQALGLKRAELSVMVGGNAIENALITRNILNGTDQGPRRDIVLLNAAAALSTDSGDLKAGLAEATAALDSGTAIAKLDAWIAMTQALTC